MPITLSSLEQKSNRSYYDKTAVNDGKNVRPMLDLRSNVWRIDFEKIAIDEWIDVDKTCEMRLDTISKLMYGTEDYTDVLAKFNKISNVFEIKIGDVIIIPNITSFFENLKKINYKSKEIVGANAKKAQSSTSPTFKKSQSSPAAKKVGTGLKTYKKTPGGNIVM